MASWQLILIFAFCIGAMSWASARLTISLERIGTRLGFSDGLLGIITALGADAPEISSAFVAMLSAHHEVSLGVVLGSNIFNLAGLLGLSALIAGRVTISRRGLWFNGGISLVISVLVLFILLQWLPVSIGLLFMLLLLVPYVTLLAMSPKRIERLRLPVTMRTFVSQAMGHCHHDARKHENTLLATGKDTLWAILAIGLIIATSFGAVTTAITLGGLWDINHTIIGMLILAALTSIPNVIAAIQLSIQGKGAAVVSESLNSNSLNILAGIMLPALIIGFAAPSATIIFTAAWLLLMKVVTLFAASHRRGLHRGGGLVIILLYLVFVIFLLHWY